MKYKKVIIGILTFVLMCLTGIELRADLATPKSIRIECPDEVARGGTITCICIATYDNGVSKEVKPEWTIESGDYYGAIVTSGNHGMLTGKAAGTVTVRARYYTGTSYTPTAIPAAFTISTATKRVNVYELSSLEINGPDKVTVGGTVNFTCTANYSNGTRSAVKPTWSISSGGVYGSIYPSVDGFTGIFTGKADGIVTVQAQFTDSGVTKTVTKNVTVGVILNSLTIYGKSSVNVGSTSIYTCKATYSDGSTKTVTPIWSISSGGSYASITSGGVLTGNAAGSVGIKASYTEGGVTQTEVVRVTITTVVVKPSIETQPRSQTVTEGSSVTFSVTASGSTPLNYQWKKNGTAISGATSASYTIKSATTSDAGSYTVTVSNSAGSVTSSAATLTVGGKPSITTQPKSQTVDEDSSVTFSVAASGTAPLSYQWYKGSRKISGATSSTYKINSVKSSDAGSYYVVVGNSAGSVTSSGAMLNVLVKPGITTQPKSQTVTEGSSVTFSVVVEGDSNSNHYQTVSSDSPSGIEGDKAVVFNGVDYLCGWTDQLFDVTKPITIETWVYIDPASEKSIEGFVSYGKTLKIGCTSDHYFVFTMSGVEDVKSSIPVDPVNGWQHLAAAWTPGVGVTFYFNGMEWETIETTNMPRAAAKEVINGGEVYRITVGAEAGGNPTQGMLDRVRVHQAVLTADQLDSDPANPKPVRADTLFAFDFNKETEMPYSSTTTPVIVLNEDPAEGAAEAATVQWSEDSPSGKEGNYSLYFNGSQQATMPADYLQFDRTDPSFTVEAWVKGEPQSNRQIIFSNNGPGARFSFSIASDYSVFATLYGVVDIGSGAMIPQDGKWHHIAFCHDYTDKMLLFYVDGALSDFGSYSGAMAFDGNWTTSYIGSEGGNYYKGNIARLRVHTGVLDPRNLDYYSIDRRVAPEIVSLNIPAVVAGEKATMSVEATGSQPMTYQWFLNGVAIEGATSREYTIEEATLADAGAYTVKVTNDEAGVTSDPEALVVSSAPGSLVKLVDFQMDERSGNTTASTVGGAVATWDADLVPVIHSSETPSGLLGDYSVEFAGNGFLIGDLGNNALPLDKGFTWESWVYRAVDGQGSYEDFIRIGNSIKVGLNTAKVFQGTFLGIVDLNSNATLETGVWYHLAVAWEPGVGVHFYVNGEDAGTVADTRAPNALQNNLMTLAADNGGGCKFWGKLDRTRVHLGVLTAEQLDCEAANPKPVTENTIFDYQFNAILTDADGDEYFESNGQADVAEYIAGARATTWTDGPYGVFNIGTTLVDSALKCAGAPALFNPDGIDFGDTTDLSYSLEAWVKDVPKSASRQVFFMVPGNEAGTAPRVSFSVGANHTIFSTALGVVDYDSGVEIPTDSEWHHIVLAFNMNAQLVSIYLDGQLAAAKKYTYGLSLSANSNNGSLGAEYNGGLPFYGTVDRVKLWKGVLGPESMDYPPAEPLAPVPPVGDLELSYSIEGADLVLRWAAETGASLEVAPTADSANWTILQGELVGGAYQCKVPMTEAAGFYRLVK